MVEAFSFEQLMLFGPEIPDRQPELSISDSLLFQPEPTNGTFTAELVELEPESEEPVPVIEKPVPEQEKVVKEPLSVPLREEAVAEEPEQEGDVGVGKTVRLLDGSTFTLRTRTWPKHKPDFSIDDSLLNMDALHEKVKQRESYRKSRLLIRRLEPTSRPSAPQVWAEKYRPKKFMQLCPAGNESHYRSVMHWLRKWGSVVFGAEVMHENVDHLGRPFKKVLLVHGPLGVGKTSTVHLLARQMGYNVQELNAANSLDSMHGVESTDGAGRFANATAALKLKIKNALTTNSITSNGKPTCLVVDEIDSSINSGDIVKVIADLVAADRGDRKKNKFVLNRPIICIANDIYTSLRYGTNPMEKLRSISEMVAFKRPIAGFSPGVRINVSAQKSVKEFLTDISNKERLGLDSKEIAEVFEVCDGDIRACINHLQFACRKLDRDVYAFVNESKSVAKKDANISWFSLVDRLFRRDHALSKDENFDGILELMSTGDGKSAASGSLDKIIRGCFNRYLDAVHLQDDSVVKPAIISDWLYYYDTMSMLGGDTFFYPTLVALKFWSLFSEMGNRRFNNDQSLLPNARGMEFDALELLKRNKASVKKLVSQLPVESRISYSGSSTNHEFYVCQFVPFLAKMLSPEIGSAKVKSTLKPHEKALVEKLAALIKKFGIIMETQRDLDSHQTLLLFAPNWDEYTMFSTDEKFEQNKRVLNAKRTWLFPLLQAEIEQVFLPQLKRQRESTAETTEKAKKSRMTSSVDYFKSQYDGISTRIDAAKPVSQEATRIWVKYHEGFSNAVRKNIGWCELWAP